MISDLIIRKINDSDYIEITNLSIELGYRIDEKDVQNQINTIIKLKDHFVFTAILQDIIVGYVHGFLAFRLTSKPFLEISGLVVKEDFRKYGIGTKLIEHLEKHVNDVNSVRVRCNVNRITAHKFYLNLGYTETKQQIVFEKNKRVINNE